MRLIATLSVGSALFAAGCTGGPGTGQPPPASYDAPAIAKATVQAFDTNKNGTIEDAELDACPALRSALTAIDKNGDRKISESEMQQRVEQYVQVGPVSVTCVVKLNGKPLAGAAVTFEPEKCMGEGLKRATSTTDKDGTCSSFEVDGRQHTALPAGLYRIRVTKDGENLPARYNTQSTLGAEVFPEPRQGDVNIELTLSR